eukprot:GGOE01041533.1.p1 GENE.GGOE01041533.1~~GGOE01041533.1.p1  ORF type:complete len:328 (+),score=89.01 GGOE01041533.1:77-1060(+)
MGRVVVTPALLCLTFCLLLSLTLAEGSLPAIVRLVEQLKSKMTPEEVRDPVIVAESNSRFHRMTRWWIDIMNKLGLSKFVIVALDPVEYHRLKKMNQVVAWHRGLNMNYSATTFRSDHYNQIVNYKWQIVVDLLKHGHDLLLTDVDIFWRRNPLPYLRDLPYCHMYLTVDLMGIPEDEGSTATPKPHRLYPPFSWEGFENRANTGFCYLRSKPSVIELAETVLTKPLPGMDDQYTFNTHFNAIWQKHRSTSRTHHGAQSCAKYGNLTFHMLRPDLFQNRLIHMHNPQYDNEYYTLHFNWLGDYTEKMNAMIGGGFMNASYRRYRTPL